MDGSAIRTPLGPAELDSETAAELAAAGRRIGFNGMPHAGEHSAENQIPFVQAALPGVKLVVGLIGDHEQETLDDLVKALVAASKKRKLLVVASTDLLHDPDYDLVGRTDRQTLSVIASMDASKLASTWSHTRQVCCGIGPVLTAMKYAAAMGCAKGTLLYYRNSGDDFPESRGEWVVGYGAVAFGVAESRQNLSRGEAQP
jgi:AmmeMemoRadiSam system protein B